MKLRFFQDLLHKCVAKLENQIFHFFVDFLTTNLQCNSLDNIADEVVFVTIESRMTLKFVNLNFNCFAARFLLRFKHKDSKGQSLAGQRKPAAKNNKLLELNLRCLPDIRISFSLGFPFASIFILRRHASQGCLLSFLYFPSAN